MMVKGNEKLVWRPSTVNPVMRIATPDTCSILPLVPAMCGTDLAGSRIEFKSTFCRMCVLDNRSLAMEAVSLVLRSSAVPSQGLQQCSRLFSAQAMNRCNVGAHNELLRPALE